MVGIKRNNKEEYQYSSGVGGRKKAASNGTVLSSGTTSLLLQKTETRVNLPIKLISSNSGFHRILNHSLNKVKCTYRERWIPHVSGTFSPILLKFVVGGMTSSCKVGKVVEG